MDSEKKREIPKAPDLVYRRSRPVEVDQGGRVSPAKPPSRCRLPDRIAGRVEQLARGAGRVSDELGVLWDREVALMGDAADDRVRQARQQALEMARAAERLQKLLNS